MNEFINDICSQLPLGFQPLTIVYNNDGFLAQPNVCNNIAQLTGIEVVVGSSLELRVHFELNLRRNPNKEVIYIVTKGKMLPDIEVRASRSTFKITSLFTNFVDKETISSLPYEVLKKLYDRHIQGLVSSDRLQMLLNDAERAAEVQQDFGEAPKLFNEIVSPDWSDIATIKRVSSLFAKSIEGEKYPDIEQHLKNTLNFDFQHYLDDTYWNSLNASPIIKPQSVAGIMRHIRNNYDSSQKVSLVVVDGMAFWQYEILREELEENHISPKHEEWTYSWIPSITALSRQAIFRGEAPRLDYTQSPQSERNLWLTHWNASLSPEYIYEEDNISPNRNCKRLAYVTVALDERMHSSSSYLDLLALTKIWAKDFVKVIARIKQLGFTILLTTDHGNVLATGWRPFTATEKAHLYGRMSRGHRHAIFMNGTASRDFERDLGYAVKTMHRDDWFAIREDQSFTTEGKKEITHGGSHLFEVMIPFIKI